MRPGGYIDVRHRMLYYLFFYVQILNSSTKLSSSYQTNAPAGETIPQQSQVRSNKKIK